MFNISGKKYDKVNENIIRVRVEGIFVEVSIILDKIIKTNNIVNNNNTISRLNLLLVMLVLYYTFVYAYYYTT